MTQIEQAKATLFGPGGLAAGNVSVFPGEDPSAGPERIAAEINRALAAAAAGDFEDITDGD